MSFLYYTVFTLLVIVALLLILLILIQKGRGGGLSGAFGGGGGGSAAFGAKTGDVLTWATACFFGVFILLAVFLDLLVNSQYKTVGTAAANTGGNGNPTLNAGPVPAPQPPVNPGVLPTPATAPASTSPIATTGPSINLNPILGTGQLANPLAPALQANQPLPAGMAPLTGLPTTVPSVPSAVPPAVPSALNPFGPSTPGTGVQPTSPSLTVPGSNIDPLTGMPRIDTKSPTLVTPDLTKPAVPSNPLLIPSSTTKP